jgi:glucosamine 6-phosphate synthetase-like amidotransferase/phosphosugar isomerase protein
MRRDDVEGSLVSGTDDYVVSQWIEDKIRTGASPLQALQSVRSVADGQYALAALFDDAPGMIYLARGGYPVAVGYGDEDRDGYSEMFISSNPSALSHQARRVARLVDGDVAIVSRFGTLFFDGRGREVQRPAEVLDISELSTRVRSDL